MNLKKLIKKEAKGVVGESLPVQPALLVKLMNVKGKLTVAIAAVAASDCSYF